MDKLKEKICKETGVPAALLNGDTEEELRARAAALKAYRESLTGEDPDEYDGRTAAEQFAIWADKGLNNEFTEEDYKKAGSNRERFSMWMSGRL